MAVIGFSTVPKRQEALKAAGCEAVYEDMAELLHAARKNQGIMVVDLREFGSSRQEIADAITRIRAKGAGLVEAGTGRHAFDYGAEWMADTIRMLANERRGGELGSSEVGKKGQKASLKARRKGQRPWTQCEAIWADKSHCDTAAAVAAINEGFKPRSKTALYNRLGKRNVAAGRRS